MKFKTAQPEDFTDVEGYQYKLAHAYGKNISDFMIVLLKVSTAINVYEESERGAQDLQWMLDFLKRTIKEFEETQKP